VVSAPPPAHAGTAEVWSDVRRTLLAVLLQAGVVAVLVVGTTAFVTFNKTVTLSVDGQRHQVRTFGRTVGDVLANEGIRVDSHDLVTPTPDSSLDDGETIVVRYGRPLVLTVDGATRTVWTTARSVDEALMMFGLRTQGAVVSRSRSTHIKRGGMALDVQLPHQVTLLADGRRREITTTALTVRDVVAGAGIRLNAHDRISPAVTTAPADGQVVAVTRVNGKKVVQQVPIHYRTITRRTSSLYKGTTQVQRSGQVGLRVRVFRETFIDGKLAKRKLLRDRLAAKPVAAVVLVGTKPVPVENAPSADGLNWAALADCESGGNPDAYNPAGPYYGLYQFSADTWHAVGGQGLPTDYGWSEQTYRAQILYEQSGSGQWPVCGPNLYS
jgi:resuscitation-promoting factor RpfB